MKNFLKNQLINSRSESPTPTTHKYDNPTMRQGKIVRTHKTLNFTMAYEQFNSTKLYQYNI